jgi:hypothetical protein
VPYVSYVVKRFNRRRLCNARGSVSRCTAGQSRNIIGSENERPFLIIGGRGLSCCCGGGGSGGS